MGRIIPRESPFLFITYLQLRPLTRLIPFLLLFLWGKAISGGLGGRSIPWGDPTYGLLVQLKLQGLFPDLSPSSLPYTEEEIAQGVEDALWELRMGKVKLSPYSRNLLRKLEEEWGIEEEGCSFSFSPQLKLESGRKRKSENNFSFTGDFSFSPLPSLLLSQGIRVEGGNWYPSWLLVRPWRKNLWGSTPYTYIKWGFKGGWLLMGRYPLKWGPSPDVSLLLGDNSPSFDQLQVGVQVGRLRFICLSTKLDTLEGANRYLSAHRIELRARQGLYVGLSEVVLYGGEKRGPELYYLNPLTIYYGEQFNHKVDDNILLGGDFSWYTPWGRLYGELMVDDFQYDLHSEPQQIGLNGGIDLVTSRGVWLNIEYTRVNNWVYGQNKPWNRYTYWGKVIGWEMGPDADQLSSAFLYPLSKSLWMKVSIRLRRKGEGRVETSQSSAVPWPKSFPSGVVERNLKLGAEVGCLSLPFLWFRFGLQVEREWNRGNIKGKGFTSPGFELELSYRWKKPTTL